MSHIDPGPLATYESLADPHLTGYFNNSRMRRHLRKMGLITSRGNIVSEKVFRLNNARKEHQRHIRDVLAQAIIHKALDMERHRQMHIKKQLEEIGKVERVRRVRAERALRGDEDLLPLLLPPKEAAKGKKKHGKESSRKKERVPILKTVTDSEDYEQQPPQSVGYPAIPSDTPYNTRTDRMKTPYPEVEVDNQHLYELDREALRSFTLNLSNFDLGSGVSPYSVPPLEGENTERKRKRRRPATAIGTMRRSEVQRPRTNTRSLRLHRREPPMMHRTNIHSLARITFKYLGKMVSLDHEEEDPRDEVVVMQQHCGGENLTVFKGLVMKGDNFVIISRRHRTFPFSLTFYLNGVQVERLSTCCEYKHKRGVKLGAKSSHFGIVRTEGSQPCFKCLISQGKLKTKPDPTPPPTGSSKPTSVRRKRRMNKLRGADGREADEYTDDFQKSSSKSSSEEEVHHDAGKENVSITSSDVSSESSSDISDVSDTEDEDGGGHLSSDTDSKLSSILKDDSSTSSTESVDSQKRAVPPPKPAEKKSKPAKPAKVEQPSKSKVVRKTKPAKKEPKPKTPPPVIQKDSPKGSRSRSSSSSSSTSEASVTTAEEVPAAKRPETVEPKVEPTTVGTLGEPKVDSLRPTTPIPKEEPEDIPERPKTPEPESSSLSSSESESDNVRSSDSQMGVKPVMKEDTAATKVPEKKQEKEDEEATITVTVASNSGTSSSSSDSESESSKSDSSDSQKGAKKLIKKEPTSIEKPKEEATVEKEKPKPKTTEATAQSITEMIEGKIVANLSGIKLSGAQVDELVTFFKKNPSALSVQKVILKGCKIGDVAGMRVLKLLQRNKLIKSIDMTDNDLTEKCIEIITDICHLSPIDELILENNPLGDEGCEKLITSFSKSQATVVTAQLQKRVSQSLIASVLKDSRKELSEEYSPGMSSASSMSSLASTAVADTVALHSLNLANTGALEGAMEKLGEYLALNPKLTHLDISNNMISSKSLDLILRPDTNKNLRSLWMNHASLTDKDVELMVEKLEGKSLLTELSLKGNEITEEGQKKLVELRNNNKSLKTLHLY